MFSYEVFIFKLATIDRNASTAISLDKITSLNHEILNNPVKMAAFIANRNARFPVFPCAELPKVFSCPGNNIGEELHLNSSRWNGAYRYIEEDDGILWVWRLLVPFYHPCCCSTCHVYVNPTLFLNDIVLLALQLARGIYRDGFLKQLERFK